MVACYNRFKITLALYPGSTCSTEMTLEGRPDQICKRDSELRPSTFDMSPKRKRLNVFKIGNLWIFKHFFEDKTLF
jgi:hypothetical protein